MVTTTTGKVMAEQKDYGEILKDNFAHLLEANFDGNASEMERQTGINRSIITEIVAGRKTAIGKSTIDKLRVHGISPNWALYDIGKPYLWGEDVETNGSADIAQGALEQKIETLADSLRDIKKFLEQHPQLSLDDDVRTVALELAGELFLLLKDLPTSSE